MSKVRCVIERSGFCISKQLNMSFNAVESVYQNSGMSFCVVESVYQNSGIYYLT